MPSVTLREIAARVGCTRSTVSYALRNHPNISVATRNRVRKIARELGWHSDLALRQQMALVRSTTQRTNLPNIGVVMVKSGTDANHESNITRYLDGLRSQADTVGLSVDVFDLSEEQLKPLRLQTILESRGIAGLVYLDIDRAIPAAYWKLCERFPLVSLGMRPESVTVNLVSHDLLSIGHRAVSELIEAGYRRPGVILSRGGEERWQWAYTGGITAGLSALPEEARVPLFYGGSGSGLRLSCRDYQSLLRWYDHYRPDVLLTLDPRGVERWLVCSGKGRVSEIYSLDWRSDDGSAGGIDQRHESLGAAAIDLVLTQMERGETGLPDCPLTVHVRERWVGRR